MNEILKQIGKFGLVPAVTLADAKDALPLGRALLEGGLPIAEVTFRTAAAEESIRTISKDLPEILLGAGTILTIDQVERAVAAGAKYIISPGFNPEVVKYCVDRDIAIIPGCSNPTDIEMALGFGLDVVKFFPAESFGGLKTLKAISGPYGMFKFIPTGGIDSSNISEYLSFNKVLACSGSWMVKDDLIKAGNFAEITRLTKEAVAAMMGFDLAHVGINTEGAEKSIEIAKRFAKIFGLPLKEGNSSNFVGAGIEIVNGIGNGKNGHVAIKTKNIERAIFYLEHNGTAIDINTAKYSPAGNMIAVYLAEELEGFAVHLLEDKL